MSKKRAFVKYTKQGKIIPGSLIVTTKGGYPVNGLYQEVPSNLCCMTTIQPPVIRGRNFYVSSSYTGATSNGNESTPWKSLADVQANFSLVKPGDQVLFKKGDTFSGTLTISKSGLDSTYPIRFGAYGTGDNPKFIGTGSTIERLFYMYDKKHIEFYNLWITDPSISPTDRNVLAKIRRAFVVDGPNGGNVLISNCKIELVGVGAYFASPYNTMELCDVGNLRMVVNDAALDNDYGANAVVISSSYNKILKNNFHDCWANSIDYTYDGGAVEIYANSNKTITNNYIAYNTFYDGDGACEVGGGSNSIINNTTFAYNKMLNNGSGLLFQNSGTYAANIKSVNVYNNVFIESAVSPRGMSSALIRFRAQPTGTNQVIFRNNVVQIYGTMPFGRKNTNGTNQLDGPAFVHSNNVFKLNTAGSGSVLNLTLGTGEVNTSATIFTTTTGLPTTWNYTPSVGSILIDAGVNVGETLDFAGNTVNNPPNIGILE